MTICHSGYMAPEYLVRGQLTEKTDVYAFGVLALEIVCGRKNSVFTQGSSSVLQSVRFIFFLNCLSLVILTKGQFICSFLIFVELKFFT